MKLRRLCTKSSILCTISMAFVILGVLIITTWSHLYHVITRTGFVLTPTSTAYHMWKKNPIPLTIDFYFHNWTNSEAVHNNTVKPSFKLMGPYRFIETKEKSKVTWNDNSTVTFRHLRTWFFDREHSVGPLSDEVTTVNPVTTSAAYAVRNWNYIVKKGLSVTLNTMNQKVHIVKSVGELLFEGYEDKLMNIARSMPFLADSNMPEMDKFGWFYGRNGSDVFEGTFNMDTGVDGQLGRLYEWKGSNRTSFYLDKCSDIDGSAGEFFPQNLNKDSIVKFFSSDLCRPVELEYEKDVEIHNIVGYKYSAGDRFLDNGTKIVENKCFCLGDCMPSGAVNVSACRYGSPAFVSLPHFYNADPYYLDSIEGVKADKDRHEFYMVFEPKTGLPLEVAARLQLNLLLTPVTNIQLYSDVPKVYFPLIWFEQVVRMPPEVALYIKFLVNFKVICYAIGAILIFVGLLIQFCCIYRICTMKLCEPAKDCTIKERVPLTEQK